MGQNFASWKVALISSLSDPVWAGILPWDKPYSLPCTLGRGKLRNFSVCPCGCPSFVLIDEGLIFAQVINWIKQSVEGVSSACSPEEEASQFFILIYPECRRLKSSWNSLLGVGLLVICLRKSREKSRGSLMLSLKDVLDPVRPFWSLKNCVSNKKLQS